MSLLHGRPGVLHRLVRQVGRLSGGVLQEVACARLKVLVEFAEELSSRRGDLRRLLDDVVAEGDTRLPAPVGKGLGVGDDGLQQQGKANGQTLQTAQTKGMMQVKFMSMWRCLTGSPS